MIQRVVGWVGGVAERLKAPVLKTGISKGNVGSNPTPSARVATLVAVRLAGAQQI